MTWNGWITRLKKQPVQQASPPDPGVYHFLREREAEKSRIHLRMDADGHGTLLINANRIYHLNPTAALIAYWVLQEVAPAQAVAALRQKYQVSAAQAKKDYAQTSEQILALITPEGPCPICSALDLDVMMPFSTRPSAPYRMDLALTYRCNNACAHCYNARSRAFPELTTDQWKQILDQLWAQGIPHVVFTGGEPTLRDDLPELVAHAERNGQITGLNSNGRRLGDATYFQRLLDAGLDHVQITLESHDAAVHDAMVAHAGAWQETVAGLRRALDSRLYVMTNTTLLQLNQAALPATLDFLAELGVPTVGLNALIYSGRGAQVGTGLPESALPALLQQAQQATQNHQQRLIWYTPTQYCHFDPQLLELGVKGCTAALYNMCTEPNGDVLPCQSYYQSLGNLLHTPWDQIWNHELAVSLRERKNVPAVCNQCAILAECGGGCPLARQAGAVEPQSFQSHFVV